MPNETAATSQETRVPHLTPEQVDEHLAGQAKINGNLCRVDWRLIKSLEKVADILETQGASADDVGELRVWIAAADSVSLVVANEDPPGCDPKERDL